MLWLNSSTLPTQPQLSFSVIRWQASLIRCLGRHLLRVGRHVGAIGGLYDLAVVAVVCRLADGGNHLFLGAVTVNGVIRTVVLHSAFKVGRHHAHRNGRAVTRVVHPRHLNRARRMQRREHPVLFRVRRRQRLLRAQFLLEYALLQKVLASRAA